MKKYLSFVVILFSTGPALAGGLGAPTGEPSVEPPPALIAASDWTGFYVGGQVANLDGGFTDTIPAVISDPLEFSDAVYGIHAGYNYDFGQFVLGGEVEYDVGDVQVDVVGFGDSGINIDSLLLLKVRGGFDLGQAMAHATAGFAQVSTSVDDPLVAGTPPGDADGYFGSLGVAFKASDHIIVGGEILQHEFDGFDDSPTFEASATTLSLRLSYKF